MYTQFFGNYLLTNGYVTKEQLFSAMKRESNQRMKLGTLAMHSGYMTASQIDEIVIRQTHEDRKFGDLAIELCYLTQKQLYELLALQTPAFLSLGQALLDDGVLNNTEFEKIISDYRSQNSIDEAESPWEEQDVISRMFNQFFDSYNEHLSDEGQCFIKLLFNNFVRFVGNDFTPNTIDNSHEIQADCCITQSILGDYSINTYLAMSETTAITFASRYVGESYEKYDEYVQASLEDFLNLHNGLFAVNLSNEVSIELTLTPPESINKQISLSHQTIHIPILYSFGVVDFYMERADE